MYIRIKKILPKDLCEDLIKHFLNPSTSKKIETKETQINKSIDSKIITFQHAELISKWVDRLEITDKMKNSYEFKLIFRASHYEFSIDKFHEFCDDIAHTITIAKVSGSDEILGGYNPTAWKSTYFPSYKATKNSFIFSFKDHQNIENYVLSQVANKEYAIYSSVLSGPSFGYSDLYLSTKNHNFCKKHSYEKPIRTVEGKFSIEDYEVFQLI
jgi:hypothetical protein